MARLSEIDIGLVRLVNSWSRHKHDLKLSLETTRGCAIDFYPDGRILTYRNAAEVTDLDWRRASRATRTATWTSAFFLITTDILGPTGAP